MERVSPAYSEWLKHINAFIDHQEEVISQDLGEAAATFRSLGTGEGLRGMTVEVWRGILIDFAIVVAATLLAWALFRLLASQAYARIDRWLAHHTTAPAPQEIPPGAPRPGLTPQSLYRSTIAIVGALLIDIAVIALTALALLAFAGNSLLCRRALDGTDTDPASFTALRLLSG